MVPNQEELTPEGSIYNPSTQSLLRTYHWLDTAQQVKIRIEADGTASLEFEEGEPGHELSLHNLPLEHLVPRLHYQPASPPDAFDALNLLLAEYSRNGVTIPRGKAGDEIVHFRSTFEESVPWALQGDFDFVPNKYFQPLRLSVINNCLAPGLWEFSASDRSGEIYHSWFRFPDQEYYRLTARINGLSEEFVRQALDWKTPQIPLALERLRAEGRLVAKVSARLIDAAVGFSSQASRLRLSKGFAHVVTEEGVRPPQRLSDFYRYPVRLSSFLEPGLYSYQNPRDFDMGFLGRVSGAQISTVLPRTHYSWNNASSEPPRESGKVHLEFLIRLGDLSLLIGNLPLGLLVQQEDFVINGFGVGVLNQAAPVERRKMLLQQGHHPPYAYLVREEGGRLLAVNSHDLGIEQLFVRTHPYGDSPHWTVTVSSYERIVDLARYRIEIPAQLRQALLENTEKYVAPAYLTYKDDNVR